MRIRTITTIINAQCAIFFVSFVSFVDSKRVVHANKDDNHRRPDRGRAGRAGRALAGALRKPLTTRLLPMPGLKAGDLTQFAAIGDSPLAGGLCDSRVMRIEN